MSKMTINEAVERLRSLRYRAEVTMDASNPSYASETRNIYRSAELDQKALTMAMLALLDQLDVSTE